MGQKRQMPVMHARRVQQDVGAKQIATTMVIPFAVNSDLC